MPHCVFIISIVSYFTNFLNLPISNKKPSLFLTLVLSVLSEFHFHGEASGEEVVGVRLTLVWWRRGESPAAAAMPCPRWLDDRTAWCAVPVSPLFAKKNPPGSFFYAQTLSGPTPHYTKMQKDRHTAVLCICIRATKKIFLPVLRMNSNSRSF